MVAAAQGTVRIAGSFATERSYSVAMEVFRTEVERLSESAIQVDILPAQQLGGASENVRAVKIGAMEMIWVGTTFLSRTVPGLELIGFPFQFATPEQVFAVVDGPVGDALDGMTAADGMIFIGYMELGFRQLTNNADPSRRSTTSPA